MPSKKNRIIPVMQFIVVFRLLISITAVNILFGLIPGFSNKNTFAQSAYLEKNHNQQNTLKRQEKIISTKPKPDISELMKRDNQYLSTSSGGNSISIKSTDAGISPSIQMNSACTNCSMFDYGRNDAANFIPDWIINSVIQSKIFKREAHRDRTNDVHLDENMNSFRHFNHSD